MTVPATTRPASRSGPRAGARVGSHPRSLGSAAAVKAGARAATGGILVFLDGDGQHNPADIPRLLERMAQGHDRVIGARASAKSHANLGRLMANGAYNLIASRSEEHTSELQ